MQNVAYNKDCIEAMRDFPDDYFDLCVADPPYGINITGRHKVKRSQSLHVEREREHRLSEEAVDRSAVLARVQGQARSSLSSQSFIQCSTIVPRRTQRYSGNYRESARN